MPVIFAELATTYSMAEVADPASPVSGREWAVPVDFSGGL